MIGNKQSQGIIYRSLNQLFEFKESQENEQQNIKIVIKALEIYNEDAFDLLSSNPLNPLNPLNPSNPTNNPLKVQLIGTKVYVPKLKEKEISNIEEAESILQNTINKNRSKRSTNMNNESSRSHAMIFIDIIQNESYSTLTLIDLAGSEKVEDSGVKGDAFNETKNINTSLTKLKNVLNAIRGKKKHIPFRDSTLTKLLTDKLDGNSKTLMICNISIETMDFEKTKNTLLFANDVQRTNLGKVQKNKKNRDNGGRNIKQQKHKEGRLRGIHIDIAQNKSRSTTSTKNNNQTTQPKRYNNNATKKKKILF